MKENHLRAELFSLSVERDRKRGGGNFNTKERKEEVGMRRKGGREEGRKEERFGGREERSEG